MYLNKLYTHAPPLQVPSAPIFVYADFPTGFDNRQSDNLLIGSHEMWLLTKIICIFVQGPAYGNTARASRVAELGLVQRIRYSTVFI